MSTCTVTGTRWVKQSVDIAAIATAPGEGGIGIIRISGDRALSVAESIFKSVTGKLIEEYNTRTLIYGTVVDGEKIIENIRDFPTLLAMIAAASISSLIPPAPRCADRICKMDIDYDHLPAIKHIQSMIILAP